MKRLVNHSLVNAITQEETLSDMGCLRLRWLRTRILDVNKNGF